MRTKTILKRLLIFFVICAAALAMPLTALADVDVNATYEVESDSWKNYPKSPDISAVTGVLIDAETGAVLYSKGMNAQRYPASITKVMTALLVLQNCQLSDTVTMTEEGLADAYEGSSNVAPSLGETFTVDECLQMLLVKSANDIATQLAVHVSGSVAAFADLMNQTAANIGCTNTHFVNANGLENDQHYTSAYDMALIMQQAMNFQRFREIIAMPGITINATEYSDTRYYLTHVEMIVPESQYYYEGCLGGKTGYTDISQCTLVAAAERSGMTLIGVVMGSAGTEQSFLDMAALFNYGYDNFYRVEGTWGYDVISSGVITIPKTLNDLAVLHFEGYPWEDGTVLVSIQNDDRQIGSAVMAQTSFDQLMAEVEKREKLKSGGTTTGTPTPTPAVTGEAVTGEAGQAETTVEASPTEEPKELTEDEMFPEAARKDNTGTGKIFLYVAIAILAVLILIGIMMIVKGNRRRNSRRRR